MTPREVMKKTQRSRLLGYVAGVVSASLVIQIVHVVRDLIR